LALLQQAMGEGSARSVRSKHNGAALVEARAHGCSKDRGRCAVSGECLLQLSFPCALNRQRMKDQISKAVRAHRQGCHDTASFVVSRCRKHLPPHRRSPHTVPLSQINYAYHPFLNFVTCVHLDCCFYRCHGSHVTPLCVCVCVCVSPHTLVFFLI